MPKRIIAHAKNNPKTWRNIAIGAAIVALTTVGFVTFTGKNTNMFAKPPPTITGKQLEVSDISKQELKEFVGAEPEILAVQAVRVSLTKNDRSTVFFWADNDDLQAVWDEYLTRRVATPPKLFGSGESTVQNDRIANLLNGNFDCRRFNLTISYQYYPNADAIAPWVCSIATPPGFDGSGDFVGFLTFYFKTEPTDKEKIRLAKTTAEISTDIYRRDVVNTPSK